MATGAIMLGARGAAAASAESQVMAYRKIFASAQEEDVCCWYLGTMFLRPDGGPEIPALHAETLMVYRVDGSGATARMRWTEIGCFRDPVTGAAATSWVNPLNGQTMSTPRSFKDGPGSYTVTAAKDALGVTLQQTGATVESVVVSLGAEGSRYRLQQTERKVRGVRPGATPAEVAALPKAVTVLTLWADRAEVDDPKQRAAMRRWAKIPDDGIHFACATVTYACAFREQVTTHHDRVALEERLAHISTSMSLSIIGCVVNGPGEALFTDIGFTGGGKGAGMIYMAGKVDHKLDNDGMVDHIVELVEARARQIDAATQDAPIAAE